MTEDRGTHIGTGTDKRGREIDVFWAQDVEPDDDSSFISHRATAWYQDLCVGRLRAEYADPKKYERLYPTIWNHPQAFGGLGTARPGEDPRTLTGVRAADFYRRTLSQLSVQSREVPKTYAEFEDNAQRAELYETLVMKRDIFIAKNVNTPQVGYVDVGLFCDPDGVATDSRGTGIGKILYAATAITLRDVGLHLHASGLQTPEAVRIWSSMERAGWVEHGEPRGRMYLVADRIPENVFSAGSLSSRPDGCMM